MDLSPPHCRRSQRSHLSRASLRAIGSYSIVDVTAQACSKAFIGLTAVCKRAGGKTKLLRRSGCEALSARKTPAEVRPCNDATDPPCEKVCGHVGSDAVPSCASNWCACQFLKLAFQAFQHVICSMVRRSRLSARRAGAGFNQTVPNFLIEPILIVESYDVCHCLGSTVWDWPTRVGSRGSSNKRLCTQEYRRRATR